MAQQYNRFWRKNKTKVIFGSLVAVSLIHASPDIQRNMTNINSLKSQIAQNNQTQAQLQQQIEFEKQQAQIAEERYRNGCTMVVARKSPKNLATLVEGESIRDRKTRRPLPINTVVCDVNGNTGVMVDNGEGLPVVGQMAFTGNREVAIARVKKIRGARLYYNTPEVNQ